MPTLPLTLGIARGKTRNRPLSPSQTLPATGRQAIWERDGHVCAYCGFTSKKYMDVVAVDGNPENHDPNNFRTACQFCAQCFDLEQVVQMKSGFLVWMPEIDQATLNHLARAIYVARVSQGPMADTARRLLDIVMARREEAKARLRTDDPYVLAAVMRDFLNTRTYEARGAKLDGVRLFPLDRRMVREGELEFNQFPQILAFWRSKDGPFGGRLPAQWLDHYRNLTQGQKSAA